MTIAVDWDVKPQFKQNKHAFPHNRQNHFITSFAVQQLPSGKAPGADAIPAKVYKGRGLPIVVSLYVEEEDYPIRI